MTGGGGDAGSGATEVAVPTSGYDNVSSQEVAEMSVRRCRLTYAVILVIAFVLGIVMKHEVFEWIAKWAIKTDECNSYGCIGSQCCYRISFSVALFFFVHWAVSSPWNLCLSASGRIKFNQMGIFWKLLSVIPLFFVSFAIPNGFFVFWAWVCLVVSVLFLIAQLVVLLDFSYSWSDDWASREEDKYTTGLLVCTVAMFIGAIVFIALSFVYFGKGDCQLNQAMTSIPLVCGILYSGLSVVAPRGSLLPSATVFLYTAYTCFSALMMTPGECNTLHSNGTITLIISTVFSALSLAYMTVSAGTSRSAFQLSEDEGETVEEAEAASFSFFHVIMMMGSCYLAMLLTNWTIVGSDSMATINPNSDNAPMWAKLTSMFVCIVLYVWTLVAPWICTDRSFD
eukprot:CAMPEP_0174844070 /NCGR_PEP_ID=MMETSP1114-20130205/10889_1 /TAXON_ID=312471 /ORGANISM="Neobodo designis, Strain CCAP 1951/1" /LENGTH=396 /DNA_ID=CAMNT_0016078303 /DNA_START=96 /DNA_END=1289 /DNA_ORIENTATION=+